MSWTEPRAPFTAKLGPMAEEGSILCQCAAPPVCLVDNLPECESCSKPVVDNKAVQKAVINRTASKLVKRRHRCGDAPAYEYGRINEDETRLVVLYPGSYDDDIHCTLIRTKLGRKFPRYDAISYTWADESGDATKSARIHCGRERRVIPVTANCEAMLRRMRFPTLKRLIWVDAICINQEFAEERTHQVGSMSKIYKGAARVLIYLGEASEETDFILG